MKKILLFILLLGLISPVYSKVIGVDPLYGYLEDGRGQIEEYDRIPPPHEELIPKPRPTAVVSPFRVYRETNNNFRRRPSNYKQLVPDRNIWYHEHRVEPYTKDEFINVWCSGKKHVNGVDCVTEHYAITFTDVKYWSYGVLKAPFVARRVNKKAAVFCYVNNIGADSEYIEGAKKWGELYNIPVFFGTIDSYLKL